MRDANALDFDDLLYWPALALKHDAELRAELDARFRYVLIDEYQDTNQAQYAIARGLSVDHPNLCVVGDPDQSIYKFRGSDIRNILDFERDFPSARVMTLSTNYRSTKSILHAASTLIAHNRQRKPKDLFTDNAAGMPVTVLTFETGLDEAEGIARCIRAGGRVGQTELPRLRHLHADQRPVARRWKRRSSSHRVPFQIVKGLAFFERKENRDVLAYLRLLLNPRDDLSFLRASTSRARHRQGVAGASAQIRRAKRGGPADAPRRVAKIPAIKGKASAGLRDFAAMMNELRADRRAPPDEVIRRCSTAPATGACCMDSTDPEDQDRLANIEELITAAQQFAAEHPPRRARIGDFLENITLASDVDGWDERQDCVSVMTMHAAKGLEFPVVYLLAVEMGLLPHERSLGHDGRNRGGAAAGIRRHDAGQG